MASSAASSSAAPPDDPLANLTPVKRASVESAWNVIFNKARSYSARTTPPTEAENQAIRAMISRLYLPSFSTKERKSQDYIRSVFDYNPEIFFVFAVTIKTSRLDALAKDGRTAFLLLLKSKKDVAELHQANIRSLCAQYHLYSFYRKPLVIISGEFYSNSIAHRKSHLSDSDVVLEVIWRSTRYKSGGEICARDLGRAMQMFEGPGLENQDWKLSYHVADYQINDSTD